MPPGLTRLLLAMTVMIHHSFPLRLGAIAVYLFFALSGYWIAIMWREKYSTLCSPYQTFLISRWWRLAPVFLTSVLIAAGTGMASLVALSGSHVVTDWKWWVTQPLIAGSSWFGRLLPPSWSLDVEMQFYVLAPIIVALTFRSCLAMNWMFLLFALVWHFYLVFVKTSPESPRLDLQIVFFVLGIVYAKSNPVPGKSTSLALTLFALFCIGACITVTATRHLFWFKGSSAPVEVAGAINAIPTVISLLLVVPVLVTTGVRSGRLDRMLGDLSFPLYMIHWIPRDWYYEHVDWGRGAVFNAVLLLINFAAAIILAVAILLLVDIRAQRARVRWLRSRNRSQKLQTSSSQNLPLDCPTR